MVLNKVLHYVQTQLANWIVMDGFTFNSIRVHYGSLM